MGPDQPDNGNNKPDQKSFSERFTERLEAKSNSAIIDHLRSFVSDNIEAVRQVKDQPAGGTENMQDIRSRLLEGQHVQLDEYIKQVAINEAEENPLLRIGIKDTHSEAERQAIILDNYLNKYRPAEELGTPLRTAGEFLPKAESLNEVLMASWTGQTDKVKVLVSKNHSLDVQDSTGRDPAEIAEVTGNKELQNFVENKIDSSHRM